MLKLSFFADERLIGSGVKINYLFRSCAGELTSLFVAMFLRVGSPELRTGINPRFLVHCCWT